MGKVTSEGDLMLRPIRIIIVELRWGVFMKCTSLNMFPRICSRIVRNDLGKVVTMGMNWGNYESLINFSSGRQGPRKGKERSDEAYSSIS